MRMDSSKRLLSQNSLLRTYGGWVEKAGDRVVFKRLGEIAGDWNNFQVVMGSIQTDYPDAQQTAFSFVDLTPG